MPDRSDKTEKPTARKIKQAKRDGQVARSPDVGNWLGLLVAVYLLRLTVQHTVELSDLLFRRLGDVIQDPEPAAMLQLLGTGILRGALAVAPLAGGLLLTGVATAAAQGGVRISAKSFRPKWEQLNPLKGLKKVFGVHGAWELVKALLKTSLLSLLLYQTVRSIVPIVHTGGVVPLVVVLHQTGGALFSFARNAALVGLVMAAADYAYQLQRYRRGLRMSKQEVKDEHRNTEGDPQIKSAIKSRQLAMRRGRMIAAIADADVVLVNPTHVAVALKYQAGNGAPRVVAKGAGVIAARIRAEADKHRVPMVQDVPLARALYRVCDLGQEIPHELFMAVARILAFVFSLRRRGSAAGLHKSRATPESEVAAVKKRRGRRRRAVAVPHR